MQNTIDEVVKGYDVYQGSIDQMSDYDTIKAARSALWHQATRQAKVTNHKPTDAEIFTAHRNLVDITVVETKRPNGSILKRKVKEMDIDPHYRNVAECLDGFRTVRYVKETLWNEATRYVNITFKDSSKRTPEAIFTAYRNLTEAMLVEPKRYR